MALDIATLESWLWDAACVIRGPVDAPKFKDYILPLIFLKRLSDVFEDEIVDPVGATHPTPRRLYNGQNQMEVSHEQPALPQSGLYGQQVTLRY